MEEGAQTNHRRGATTKRRQPTAEGTGKSKALKKVKKEEEDSTPAAPPGPSSKPSSPLSSSFNTLEKIKVEHKATAQEPSPYPTLKR